MYFLLFSYTSFALRKKNTAKIENNAANKNIWIKNILKCIAHHSNDNDNQIKLAGSENRV
jgi:hypothetical protein